MYGWSLYIEPSFPELHVSSTLPKDLCESFNLKFKQENKILIESEQFEVKHVKGLLKYSSFHLIACV